MSDLTDFERNEKPSVFRDFAESLAYDLLVTYATKGALIYNGAVELSPDDCKRVLFDIIADIHAEDFRRTLAASA